MYNIYTDQLNMQSYSRHYHVEELVVEHRSVVVAVVDNIEVVAVADNTVVAVVVGSMVVAVEVDNLSLDIEKHFDLEVAHLDVSTM